MADKLSLKPSILSKYINILEDRGVLSHEKVGREKKYYIINENKVIHLLNL